MRVKPLLFLSLVPLLPGCSASEHPASSIQVRDSAGVRIVENSLDLLDTAPEWVLSPSPTVKLGVLDGADPLRFYEVRGAVLLQGLIWVLDGGSSELRSFQLDGAHVQTTGRSGEGPGEFIYPLNLVALDPDTLVVWDHRTRRISYFDPTGTFLRSGSIISNFQNPSFVSAFDDGSFLFSDSRPVFPTTGAIEEAPFFLIRFGPDGLLTDSLGVFPGGQMKRIDGPPGFTLVTFSPVTCVSGDRGTFWVSTGKEPEIRERKPNGELVQVVRWHVPDRTVQKEHVEAFFSEQLQDAPTEEIRRRLRQLQAEAPVADEFPVLDQIVVDRVGRIWIRQYRRPMSEGGNPWIIFGRDGELTARVRIPVHIQPRDFGEDYVLGVTKGEYDEEYVVLFELQKSGAGR